MKNHQLSCCYYPTRVVLLDDNQNFLQEMQLGLSLRKINSLTFQRCNEFIDYLHNYSLPTFVDLCMQVESDGDNDNYLISVDVGKISAKAKDEKRFDEITVALIDYAMPEMDGITLLSQLKTDYPIKYILLTGEADEKIAVDAFNRGLIHAFVRKDTSNLAEVLTEKILHLQNKYFADLSNLVLDRLTKAGTQLSCFKEHAYLELVQNILVSKNITEYYLIDELGSFLLIDASGARIYLVVRDEATMQYHHQLATDYQEEKNVPSEVIQGLAQKNSLVFLGQNQAVPPSEWADKIYPAKMLSCGTKNYYYALVSQ